MIAIFTKYVPPTNTRGARIKAYTDAGHKITISNSMFNADIDAHKAAVVALCNKMDWQGTLTAGGTNNGYVWIFTHQNAAAHIVEIPAK